MDNPDNIHTLKSTRILVYVEEVVQDLLIVSYDFDSQFFQGILLNSSKRRFPPGITAPLVRSTDEELFCVAVNQRVTMLQEVSLRDMRARAARKPQPKMSVRLRPRQVLCSKCRSVCTENSENVCASRDAVCVTSETSEIHLRMGDRPGSKLAMAVANSRRSMRVATTGSTKVTTITDETTVTTTTMTTSTTTTGIQKQRRPMLFEGYKNRQLKKSQTAAKEQNVSGSVADQQPSTSAEPEEAPFRPSLVPKLSRLQPTEISNALHGKLSSMLNGAGPRPAAASPKSETSDRRDALPDECSVTPEADREAAVSLAEAANIPQNGGVHDSEGQRPGVELINETSTSNKMVLRKKTSIGSMEDLWDESIFEDQQQQVQNEDEQEHQQQQLAQKKTTPVLKISYGTEGQGTVLKIPARVRNNTSEESETDEAEADGGTVISPPRAEKAARKAHKRARKQAKKRVRKSPRHSPLDEQHSATHRSRHKIKRKRKHKTRNDGETGSEKLSISFKRVDGNAYAATSGTTSPDAQSPRVSNEECATKAEQELVTYDGNSWRVRKRTFQLGEVIWGRRKGYGWWPGKITSFEFSPDDEKKMFARVSWFGITASSTSSTLVSCADNISSFLDNYKSKFNKNKHSGQYKNAVQLAMADTKKKSGVQTRMARCAADI